MKLLLLCITLCVFNAQENASFQLQWLSDDAMMLKSGDTPISLITLDPVEETIPGVKNECLFTGKLRKDKSSRVTAHGCFGGEEVIVSISSKLLPNNAIEARLRNGTTTIISLSQQYGYTNRYKRSIPEHFKNDAIIPPPDPNPISENFRGDLPESVYLETTLWYDNTLLEKFGHCHDKTKMWLGVVVEFTRTLLARLR